MEVLESRDVAPRYMVQFNKWARHVGASCARRRHASHSRRVVRTACHRLMFFFGSVMTEPSGHTTCWLFFPVAADIMTPLLLATSTCQRRHAACHRCMHAGGLCSATGWDCLQTAAE
ncbi:hypothetical protein ABPG75_004591 [Micractinium tetrahymenae]